MDTNGHTILCEDYVSFEVAKLLKEKGFDEPCQKCYYIVTKSIEDVHNGRNTVLSSLFISCPTLQMTCKWLREIHKIDIEIFVTYKNKIPHYQWRIERLNNQDTIVETPCCSIYEEAVEAAIKYCIENLI